MLLFHHIKLLTQTYTERVRICSSFIYFEALIIFLSLKFEIFDAVLQYDSGFAASSSTAQKFGGRQLFISTQAHTWHHQVRSCSHSQVEH